jgi:hypothetical protein
MRAPRPSSVTGRALLRLRQRRAQRRERAGLLDHGADDAGRRQGAEITIEAEGWDAKEALEAVAGLVEAGFHED